MLMAIIKFQRSSLSFQSTALILEPNQYIKTVFSETIGPIKLKFYLKTPYDKLPKIYTNCSGQWSHDQDGRHAHTWYLLFKNLFLQNQNLTWYLAVDVFLFVNMKVLLSTQSTCLRK